MREKNLTGIGAFLQKPKPEKFDFKDLMREYYEYYTYLHEGDDAYSALLDSLKGMENSSPSVKWYKYKTLDKAINKKGRFDCDNWNDTCELTKQIYKSLWGWEKNGGGFGTAKGFDPIALGGDSMNSVATTLNAYVKYAESEGCKKEIDKIFSNYMWATGCIGNFVLVPAHYNGYRGLDNCINDYWDLSLYELKRLAGPGKWLSAGLFARYVNYFFLWDYVACDEKKSKYYVKSLLLNEFRNSNEYNSSYMVSDRAMPRKEEIPIFLKNATWAIERRGIFMTAMLQLQADIGPDMYDKLRKEIFTSASCYSSFCEVLELLLKWLKGNEIVLPEKVRGFLEKEREFEDAIKNFEGKQ